MIDFKNAKPFRCESFDHRYKTYIKYVLEFVKTSGVWLEFGVATGETTKYYVSYMTDSQKPLYGFDWFNGLPESWANHQVGAFTNNGLAPSILGAEMVVGLYEDTLPEFVKNNNDYISVLIIDCDLYSSTKTIFYNCKNKIQKGTVIIFDELYNGDGIYNDWKDHEYKAFMEFVSDNKVEFEWVAFVEGGEQAACIITKI